MSFDLTQQHRRSIRLKDYNYAQAGAYFITLCTQDRECSLGQICGDIPHLSAAGEAVQQQWQDLPSRFNTISLDACIVMPNHLHGIIVIHSAGAPDQPTFNQGAASSQGAASGAPTLGDIIRAFKSLSAIAANRLLHRTKQPFWQRNYWEHVIRSEAEWYALREYIQNNPKQWELDSLYAKGM